MVKELQGLEEKPKAKMYLDSLRTLKRYRIVKRQVIMAYVDIDLKNSLPFLTE